MIDGRDETDDTKVRNDSQKLDEPAPDNGGSPDSTPFSKPEIMNGYPLSEKEKAEVDKVVDEWAENDEGVENA